MNGRVSELGNPDSSVAVLRYVDQRSGRPTALLRVRPTNGSQRNEQFEGPKARKVRANRGLSMRLHMALVGVRQALQESGAGWL
jgi:hypothetical protein